MTEIEDLTKQSDALVEEYYAGSWSPARLLELRRELAVLMYRATSHVKDVFGNAGLTYLQRKYRIAESIVDARANDEKVAMNILEQRAQKMPSVRNAQEAEVWAEAAKDALKMKIDATKQVLMSMSQEIADSAHEKKTTHYQGG